MQRLFPSFPGGWPGIGLLILRASAGLAALAQGSVYLAGRDTSISGWIAGLVAFASGVALLAGFLTPIAGAVVGIGAAAMAISWIHLPFQSLFEEKVATLFALAIAAAIGCLGPGAYSIDARLFGRREIIIPHPARGSRRVSE